VRSSGLSRSRRTARATASGSSHGTTLPQRYRCTISTARGVGVVITGIPCAMYSMTFVGMECR